ncbi:MAG: glycosyl hydrolase family 18 protein, partial [Dehalococcoidia bacterium]
LAAIVVGLVLVGAFLIFQVCSGGGCEDEYCATDRDIAAPEGYERISKVFEYDLELGQPEDGRPLEVALPLTETTEDTGNLSFFRYIDETETWEPVASAAVETGGERATAVLTEAPAAIAVLRRLSAAGHVVAYLPAGASLHADAAGKVTILHTLDFVPAADGGITGEASVVQADASFEHYPVISADAANGANALVTSTLANSQSRSNHVQQILAKAQEANLQGVDISYFDLNPDQRSSFALFVAELARELHRQRRKLTVTLPSPVVANERVDEGAYDWTAIGAAADLVKVAPFRDQSRYRLDVPRILEHLTSVVDRQKLVLMVTPYATELSSDGSVSTMSLVEAMAIATRLAIQGDGLNTDSNVDVVGINIDKNESLTGMVWNEQTATVGFTYKFTTQRTVWIENFFSVGFKLEYISEYKLGGVGIENASGDQFLGNIWTALSPFITSGQPVLLRPHPNDLLPVWTVSGGEQEGGERAGWDGVVTWFTPSEPGTHTVKLLLSDGVAQFESEVSVNIQARERTPTASPTPSQ